MADEESFDLSNYLTDSLALSANCTAPTRAMSPSSVKNHYMEIINREPLEVLGLGVVHQPRMVSANVVGTPIQEFYRGLNVFMTGGTGFIGKTLTQKLIRSIPNLGQIYLLIRPKRGKSSKERFDQLFEDHVFSRMKAEVPHYQTLVTAVEGDIAEVGLGLSNTDREMLTDRVHVVFHSAADVRFVEPLRAAIASNVLGSKRVIDLARQMKSLKSYVHVSTAFSQCVRTVIEETVPKMPINYRDVLQYIETKTDEEIHNDLTRILQNWPNTYTFSKAVCEEMILEEAEDLPICIFRPAIVGPTYRDPIKGWSDNLYGPNGLFVGAALGIVHCFVMDGEVNVDVVPVDYTANCMIAVAWNTAFTPRIENTIQVYNFAITGFRKFVWKTIVNDGLRYTDYWPYDQTIWYTSFFYTESSLLDTVLFPVLHTIPGKIIDTVAAALGHPQRLSKIYDRIKSLNLALKYFSTTNWIFDSGNVMDLWNSLSLEDKKEFNFDLREVDLMEHLMLSKLGMRYYYLKEKMDSIPAAQRRLKFLKVAHYSLMTVFVGLVLKLLVSVAHVIPI